MSKPKAHYSDGTPKSRSVKPGWCCEDHAAELAEKCARLERERDEARARCEALETALECSNSADVRRLRADTDALLTGQNPATSPQVETPPTDGNP